MFKQASIILLLSILYISLSAQVIINEYSASNLNQFIDNNLKFEDWVELYNSSTETVDLSGWWLSDKENNPQKWEIPAGTEIEANGFLNFWCSGRNSGIHTNFKLTQTKGTETLVLSQPNGNIASIIPMELTLLGHSQARTTDGSNTWVICTDPSLNTSNDNSTQFVRYTTAPTISLAAGFYAASQTVTIETNETNASIRYTLDGTAPTHFSTEYIEPITIDETTILKAQVFSNDSLVLPGKMTFNTYFMNEDFTLAVISVGADQLIDLANGEGELRPIGSIEYFNIDKERTAISYGELNRHGQDSWVLPHRSLDWISRDEMGYNATVEEKLFSYSDRTDHQRLMMRASGDDNYPAINDFAHQGSAHVRDEYVHTLALEGDMKLDVRAVERIIVFLNGQYWGVYGLRERPVDHDYTKEYYDQDKYNLQYLSTWGNTWAEYGGQEAFDDWGELRDFIMNNDMSIDSNYEVAKDNIRLTSLIDYMIANLNSVASDWLNYNTGWWRGLDPDGDHKKWGYILWDNDATFDYYINYSGVPNTDQDAVPCDIDDIGDYMDTFFGYYGGGDVGQHEKIFLKLQEENEEFRQLYYSRQADLMNTVYTCENMLNTLDSMIAIIAPEMPRQINRWGGSMGEWQDNVADLRAFIEERCTLLDDGMTECFDLTGPYDLTLQVEPAGVGKIDLNTITIENFEWTGAYFGNMENLIKAKATDNDYEFSHWESTAGNIIFPDSSERKARITLTQADTLTAVFSLPTAVQEWEEEGVTFNVYPTLAKDFLTLEFSLKETMPVEVSLYSIVGQKIVQFAEINGNIASGQYRQRLHLNENIASGLYILNFRAGNKQGNVKISIVE